MLPVADLAPISEWSNSMYRLAVILAVLAFVAATPFAIFAQEATPMADAAVATPVSLAGVDPLPLTAEREAELEAYISRMLAETGVPGASVAVVQNGEVVYQQGFGVRDLRATDPAPVTPDTLMMIGSITKSMTVTMAATLVDEGKLTWETPVVNLLPEFTLADPELSQKLTIRNAFCACTGLPQRDADFIFHSDAFTPRRLIASVADFPLTAPLGELFQYSNQMFAIGGYAATAAATGSQDDLYDAYTATMRAQLLDPLDMPRSTFALSDVLASGDYAVAHGRNLTGDMQTILLEDEDSFVRAVAPAGALWSSAAEMARYVQTELARGVTPDGRRLVSAENLEATWQQQVAIPGEMFGPGELAMLAQGYGLGWVKGSYHGQPLIWHNGGTFGFSSHLAFLPEADLGIVVLTNGAGADVLTLAIQYRLLELLFEQPETFDVRVAEQIDANAQGLTDLQKSLGAVDPESIAPWLGRYQSDALGDVEVTLADGTVVFDAGELQSTMTPLLDDADDVHTYLLAEPPFAGVPATFAMRDGAPVMTMIDPATGEEISFFFATGREAAATPTS